MNSLKVIFPRMKRFDQVFEAWGAYTADKAVQDSFQRPQVYLGKGKGQLGWSDGVDGHLKIGPYCHVSGCGKLPSVLPSLNVMPTAKVGKALNEHMTYLGGDEIYFEIVVHEDGTALVIAKHNLIIGQRRIAWIDAKTIPIKIPKIKGPRRK